MKRTPFGVFSSGSAGRTRTYNQLVNSELRYHCATAECTRKYSGKLLGRNCTPICAWYHPCMSFEGGKLSPDHTKVSHADTTEILRPAQSHEAPPEDLDELARLALTVEGREKIAAMNRVSMAKELAAMPVFHSAESAEIKNRQDLLIALKGAGDRYLSELVERLTIAESVVAESGPRVPVRGETETELLVEDIKNWITSIRKHQKFVDKLDLL